MTTPRGTGRRRLVTPEILAIIPVSGQDPEFRTRVPLLGGRPLLEFTFDAARGSRLIGRTIVSTDDRRIAIASRRAGMEVPFVRRAGTRREQMARVLEGAVQFLERRDRAYRPEWIVRLQVTYPFRESGLVDRAIATVLNQDLDSAFTAFPEYDTFWYIGGDGVPQRITTDTRVPRSRRRPIYREIGGLFSMVHRSVLARGLLHGDRLGIIPTDSVTSAIDLHGMHGADLATLVASAHPRARDAVSSDTGGTARRPRSLITVNQ